MLIFQILVWSYGISLEFWLCHIGDNLTDEQSITEITFMYLQSIKLANQSIHLIPETWEATWKVRVFRCLSLCLCLLFIQLPQEKPWIHPVPKKESGKSWREGCSKIKIEFAKCGDLCNMSSVSLTCKPGTSDIQLGFFLHKIAVLYQTLCDLPQQKGRCDTWLSFDQH